MYKQKGLLIIFLLLVIVFSSTSCDLFGQENEVTNEPADNLTPTNTTQPTTTERKLTIDGVEHSYWIHIPLGLNNTEPVPVVFVIHGDGGKPQDMYKAGFNGISDREYFIVVYPYVTNNFRSDHIEHILKDLEGSINIDPNRIYATGLSLGGSLSYRVACELSDTFAAIAPVAGFALCKETLPDHPVSVIHIHGLDDVTSRFPGGGEIPDCLTFWIDFNSCDNSPRVDQENRITHISYTSCQDGTAVEIYTIEGMAHRWPGSDLPGSKIIWEFFEMHPKP